MDGGEMLQRMRQFWYNNEPGPFMVGENPITRRQIQVYGGPSPHFKCPACQSMEWLSRIHQENLFQDHACQARPQDRQACAERCAKQGDDLWTYYHQNFWYAVGCDSELNAPRACLFLDYEKMYHRYWTHNCNFWITSLRRQMAQVGTLETCQPGDKVDWDRYDWLWTMAQGFCWPKRPPLPIVMVAVDANHGNIQQMLNLEPDVLWTSYPTTYRENFSVSDKTKVMLGART